MQEKSIIYINFSQYDNTGRILDYLKENFKTVVHFSFDHLRLKNGRKTNLLEIYRNHKKIKQLKLFSLRLPPPLLFPSLPAVAVFMILQTLFYVLKYRSYINQPVFFTVNAYPAIIGILLKQLRIVSCVYYWIWDFYPLSYPDWRMRTIRYLYLLFDTIAIHYSDKLIFPNKRQLALRNSIKKIRNHYKIIPLGSSETVKTQKLPSHILGFMGMLKESQGVALLIDNLESIIQTNPYLQIEIIGSGPEEETLIAKAKSFKQRVKFYGFIDNQNRINRIVRRWFAGLAVYKPDRSNESYWGDPSKIKVYLSQGVPIITTSVSEYGRLANKFGFGKQIPYSPSSLNQAIVELFQQQKTFSQKALSYASKFYYRNLYKEIFE